MGGGDPPQHPSIHLDDFVNDSNYYLFHFGADFDPIKNRIKFVCSKTKHFFFNLLKKDQLGV